MVSGECHECGKEYKDLRKHWSLSSSCEEDPDRSAKVTLECAACGDEHEKWRYRVEKNEASYCSPECRNEGIRNGETVECDWCGDEVYKPKSLLSEMGGFSLDNHFCDKSCETKYKQENWTGENHPRWNGGLETVTCEQCGDEYEVTPAKADETKYCSHACVSDAWTDDPVEVTCDHCGTEFEKKAYNEKKTEHDLCSDLCYREWLSDRQRGSGNPAWKGGKGGVAAVRRMLGDRSWDAIAREERTNDGHVCQKCGSFQPHRKLSVHHIIPVASGGTNESWNLMSVCETCHSEIENETRNFTEPHLLAPVTE